MLNVRNTSRGGDDWTRRAFLQAGPLSAAALGWSLVDPQPAHAASPSGEISCILLFLVGGPSQIDTWDPKPGAPSYVRGPFRPIATKVPGLHLCEPFPLMAQMADRFAVVRSVHHLDGAIHESGQQLLQTGRLSGDGLEYPTYGAVLSHLRGAGCAPPFALIPGPIGNTGVSIGHGQGAGFLGRRHEPLSVRSFDLAAEPAAVRERYGRDTFGRSCLMARRLVERGVRLVTVNMFDTVFHQVSWDCHADGASLSTTLDDYRDTVCPIFDRAYTALLSDLDQRGLLERTLVVAMGEFGRTPVLNPRGGRDHWPGVWSILFAGAGVHGGQVIGSSDRLGAEPRDCPVTPAAVAATIFKALGVDLATMLPGPQGRLVPLVDALPIPGLL